MKKITYVNELYNLKRKKMIPVYTYMYNFVKNFHEMRKEILIFFFVK